MLLYISCVCVCIILSREDFIDCIDSAKILSHEWRRQIPVSHTFLQPEIKHLFSNSNFTNRMNNGASTDTTSGDTVNSELVNLTAFKLVRFDYSQGLGRPINPPRVVVNVNLVVRIILEKAKGTNEVEMNIKKQLRVSWKRLLPPRIIGTARSRGADQKLAYVYLDSVIEYVEKHKNFPNLSIKEDLQNMFKNDVEYRKMDKCKEQLRRYGHPFDSGDFVKHATTGRSGKIDAVLSDGELQVRWDVAGRHTSYKAKMPWMQLLHDRDRQISDGMLVQAMSCAANLRSGAGFSQRERNWTIPELLLRISTPTGHRFNQRSETYRELQSEHLSALGSDSVLCISRNRNINAIHSTTNSTNQKTPSPQKDTLQPEQRSGGTHKPRKVRRAITDSGQTVRNPGVVTQQRYFYLQEFDHTKVEILYIL